MKRLFLIPATLSLVSIVACQQGQNTPNTNTNGSGNQNVDTKDNDSDVNLNTKDENKKTQDQKSKVEDSNKEDKSNNGKDENIIAKKYEDYYESAISQNGLSIQQNNLSVEWKKDENGLYRPFFEDIVESAKNNIPSVFVNRNASQVFISSIISMIAQLKLSAQNSSEYNDVLYLVDELVWNYDQKDSENNRFDFDYLLNKFNDIVKENEINVVDGRIGILGNTKYISSVDKSYSIFPRSLEELIDYLNPYLSKGVEMFDFFIPDISFTSLDSEMRSWIIKHANKITILSDGNAQPYKFIRDNYLKWVNNQKNSYSQEELLKYWNEYKLSDSLKLPIDYHYFYTLESKFKIFNLNSTYINPLNDQLEKDNKSWAKLNVHSYPLNPSTISEYLNLGDDSITQDYLKVNRVNNKTFIDFAVSGEQNYDSNKKNIVFMGSSLFRKNEQTGEWRFEYQNYALEEIHQFFNKIEQLYPQSKYNYFFKLHPVYNGEDAQKYLEYLMQDRSGSVILLDPSIAWENMLAVDFNNLSQNRSMLFNNDGTSKTQLIGIQGTTTVILSTITFLKEVFNWDNEQIKSFVDIRNFPLSNKFNIIKRDVEYKDPDKAKEENVKNMLGVYQYFVASGDFPVQNEWIDMREFLAREK